MQVPEYKTLYLFLTHRCNALCSFCYRKGQYKKVSRASRVDMTVDVARQILEFAFAKLVLHPNLYVFFWGGEPTLKFDVMREIIVAYPQLQFRFNTNGGLIDERMHDFLADRSNVAFTWSLGNAYERYGSIPAKVNAELWASRLVRWNDRCAVNLMVSRYDRLYDDYLWLYEHLTSHITIDIATKFDHKQEDLERFADEYVRLALHFKDVPDVYRALNPARFGNLYEREFGHSPLVEEFHFCRTGIDRLLFDPEGGIWQCDNFYVCEHNKLGDIKYGIDYSKLSYLWDIAVRPEILGKYCETCTLFGQCPRNKCLGLNLEHQGDMLKPEPSWCAMCKTLFLISQKYVELEKERRELSYV